MPFTLTLPDHIRPVLLIYVKSDSGGLECGVEIGGLTAEKPVNMAYLTKAAISFLNEKGNVRDARIMTTAAIDGKGVVEGTRGYVREDDGGRRSIKKNKQQAA